MKMFYIGTFCGIWVSDDLRSKAFKKIFDESIDFDFRENENRYGNIGMNKGIDEIVHDYKPDIVFINNGNGIKTSTIDNIKKDMVKTKIFLWYGDQRGGAIESVAKIGAACDALLLNNHHRSQWNDYYKLGVKKIYEHHSASDTSIFAPITTENDECYDVAFFGGNYGTKFPESENRLKLIKRLHNKFNLIVYGLNWPNYFNRGGRVYREHFSKAVARAKITIGINAFNNIAGYTSNRAWNCMACGKPHVMWYYLDAESMFKNWDNVIWFKDIDDSVKIIKELINDKDTRTSIGDSGRKHIIENHTYEKRALEIKEMYCDQY
jgi:spore maturation protein CgeB